MSSIEISTSIRSGRSDCALRAKPDILMTPRSSDRCYRAETREKPDYRKSGLSAVRERQKLFTCAVILAEAAQHHRGHHRSEEHTSELQSLMRISYAVFCLTNKKQRISHYIFSIQKSIHT